MRRWYPSLVLLAAGLVAPQLGRAVDAADAALQKPGAIVAADVMGDVTAGYGEQRKVVKADDRLRVDATITTGRRSAVKLLLSNGASVQLGSEAELEFEDFAQAGANGTAKIAELKAEPSLSRTRLRLARGDVHVEVKPLNVSRGSSFLFALPAGTLRVSEGAFRAMVQMSDLGLGVCTLELLGGKAEFEVVGGKFEPVPAGRKLGFAIEIEKPSGTVRIGELPKPATAKSDRK